MKFLSAVLCLSVIGVVVADYGYFVPKAFYKINDRGERSPLYYIDLPEDAISHRFRRSPQFNNVGAGPGGLPFFTPLFPVPGFGNQGFPIPPGGSGTSTFSGISTSTSTGGGTPNLNSRFGEDETPVKVTGQTHTISGHNGVYTQTTQHLGSDGRVQTTVHKGKY